jgi:hypothetical protein
VDQLGVRRGGRRDHHGVGVAVEQLVHGGDLGPDLVGDLPRAPVVDVGDDQPRHLRVVGERPRMEGADPARPDQSDSHAMRPLPSGG